MWGGQSSEKAPVPEHAGFVRLVVADNMQGDDAGVADGRGTLVPEYTLGVEGGVGGSKAKVCVHLPGCLPPENLRLNWLEDSTWRSGASTGEFRVHLRTGVESSNQQVHALSGKTTTSPR